MKRMFSFLIALIFAAPTVLWAGGMHLGWNYRSGIRHSLHAPVRETWHRRPGSVGWSPRSPHRRLTSPAHRSFHAVSFERHRRLASGCEDFRRARHHHRGYWWPGGTVVAGAEQPVVIVNIPPPPEPPPAVQPQAVWVPPVMGTRTEAGYWDYEIKKVWKGDHWLYEQDFEKPRWVPSTTVEYVKQEGYWKLVE